MRRELERRLDRLERAAGVGERKIHVAYLHSYNEGDDLHAAIEVWAKDEGVTIGPNDRVMAVTYISSKPERAEPPEQPIEETQPEHKPVRILRRGQSVTACTQDRPSPRHWMA